MDLIHPKGAMGIGQTKYIHSLLLGRKQIIELCQAWMMRWKGNSFNFEQLLFVRVGRKHYIQPGVLSTCCAFGRRPNNSHVYNVFIWIYVWRFEGLMI